MKNTILKPVYLNGFKIGTAAGEEGARSKFTTFMTHLFGEKFCDGRSGTAIMTAAMDAYRETFNAEGYEEDGKAFYFTVSQGGSISFGGDAGRAVLRANSPVETALVDLTEVAESAIESGLWRSVDGNRPDIQALATARRIIDERELKSTEPG